MGAVATVLLLFAGGRAEAQDGTYSSYSPYSVYGIGDLSVQGTATTRSMGGVGIAMRNRRIMNLLNPAAVTARDSLSFMADFSVSGSNTFYEQNGHHSGHNTFNIQTLAMSFPLWHSTAMMVGLMPYSDMGYDFSTTVVDPALIGEIGNVGYKSNGNGSLYRFFLSAGATLWERLSLGAEFQYYFGNLQKKTNVTFERSAIRNLATGLDLQLHGASARFGLQYEQPLPGNMSLTAGATYRMKTPLKGYIDDYRIAQISSVADTLSYKTDTLSHNPTYLPQELNFGLALRKGDRWSVELDYSYSDWSGSGFDAHRGFANRGELPFSATACHSLRTGFELTPNRYDARYYLRRVTYRGGAYYNQAYYQVGGHRIDAYGITLGITLPINNRLYNGVSLGIDFGRRGSMDASLVRETYLTFNIGFNIHDIWFRKYRYE